MRRAIFLLFATVFIAGAADDTDPFGNVLQPFFAKHCIQCHGEKKVKGKVQLEELQSAPDLFAKPKLLKELLEVLDSGDMPPEKEKQPEPAEREAAITALKDLLRSLDTEPVRVPLRRLNRFQYNNAVRDLFDLNRDLFALEEKLMTRHTEYVGSGKIPDRVEVSSRALDPEPGLADVVAFPKDLRASHGFDNQANQLTLSPLLLDAFLKLSVSVVESSDFNPKTVGAWKRLFEPPAGEDADLEAAFRERLAPFLLHAFRMPVDDATLDRYTAYAMAKSKQEFGFTDCMKKVVAAALCSPNFLFRPGAAVGQEDFVLASNLSFFLWGSGPDTELLRLASDGEFAKPAVLSNAVDRMLADPKVERFLDTFPAQWMQLENVLAATPDPTIQRLFTLEKSRPASLQMLLEPLLLFDAAFLENRPVIDLIQPDFAYRSEFLRQWYGSDLLPKPVDVAKIEAKNRELEVAVREITDGLNELKAKRSALQKAMTNPIEAGRIEVDLTEGQADWEAEQAVLVTNEFVLTDWHKLGPFAGGSFEGAHNKPFVDPTKVVLTNKVDKFAWEKKPEWVDGKVHALMHARCATYLFRTVHAPTARRVEVSIGSDDSFKLWLNGSLAAENFLVRGVGPDQDRVTLNLRKGDNEILFKVSNGDGGYGFYFKATQLPLPKPVIAALKAETRSAAQDALLTKHYLSIAPELVAVRKEIASEQAELQKVIQEREEAHKRAPKPRSVDEHRKDAQRRFDDQLRKQIRANTFTRAPAEDPRFGGVITSAAMLSMTASPTRTMPIARGAWVIEVILNDPPPPPPNDVPPLDEENSDANLTIREKFAKHREHPDCAGCHARIDPLGFALENYDITGRWRDRYANEREVDASGVLLKRHPFKGAVGFKAGLVKEERRFATAFTKHLLRYATSRELHPKDLLLVEDIVDDVAEERFRLKALLRSVAMSSAFR